MSETTLNTENFQFIEDVCRIANEVTVSDAPFDYEDKLVRLIKSS